MGGAQKNAVVMAATTASMSVVEATRVGRGVYGVVTLPA